MSLSILQAIPDYLLSDTKMIFLPKKKKKYMHVTFIFLNLQTLLPLEYNMTPWENHTKSFCMRAQLSFSSPSL